MPLGLTKRGIYRRLRLTAYQKRHVWESPGTILTFPQIQALCGLVAPHYTLTEIATLLATDDYKAKSQLHKQMAEVIQILCTDEGQHHWDEFMARKRACPTAKQRKAKKEKKRVSREVFTRISDELATDEVLAEFSIEHKRLSELKERESLEGVDPLPGDSGPIVSI